MEVSLKSESSEDEDIETREVIDWSSRSSRYWRTSDSTSSECSDLDPVFSDEELSRMCNDIATNSTLEAVETALDYHLNRAQCRRKKAKQEVSGGNHARPGGRKGKRAKPDVRSEKHSEAEVGSKRLAKPETGCGMYVNQMVGNWKQLTPEVGNGNLEKIKINVMRSDMKATRNCKVNRSSVSCQQSFHDTNENSSEINCMMFSTDSDTCIRRNIESDNGVRNGSSRGSNLGECTRRRRNDYSKNTIDSDIDSTSINKRKYIMSDICDWNDKNKNDKMIDSDNDSVCSVERRDNWKKLNHDGSRSKVGSGSANVPDNGSKLIKMREHVRKDNLQDSPIEPNLAMLDRLKDRDRSTSLAMVDRLEDRDRSKLPFAEEPAFRGGDSAQTERRDSSSSFEKILYDASQPALLSPIQSLTDLTNSRQAYVSTASMVTYESLSTEQASCRQKPGKRKYTRGSYSEEGRGRDESEQNNKRNLRHPNDNRYRTRPSNTNQNNAEPPSNPQTGETTPHSTDLGQTIETIDWTHPRKEDLSPSVQALVDDLWISPVSSDTDSMDESSISSFSRATSESLPTSAATSLPSSGLNANKTRSMKRCKLDNSIQDVNDLSLPPRSRENDSQKQPGKRDLSPSFQALVEDVGLPSILAPIPSQADITIASKSESELLPTTSVEPANASSASISKLNLPAEGDQVSLKRTTGEPTPSNANKTRSEAASRSNLSAHFDVGDVVSDEEGTSQKEPTKDQRLTKDGKNRRQLKADLHIPDTTNEETEDRESMKRRDLDNSIQDVNNLSLPPRSRENDSQKQPGERELSLSIQALLEDVGLPSILAPIPSQADITIASKSESELLPTTSVEPANASSASISKLNLPAEGDQVSRKRTTEEPTTSLESKAGKIAREKKIRQVRAKPTKRKSGSEETDQNEKRGKPRASYPRALNPRASKAKIVKIGNQSTLHDEQTVANRPLSPRIQAVMDDIRLPPLLSPIPSITDFRIPKTHPPSTVSVVTPESCPTSTKSCHPADSKTTGPVEGGSREDQHPEVDDSVHPTEDISRLEHLIRKSDTSPEKAQIEQIKKDVKHSTRKPGPSHRKKEPAGTLKPQGTESTKASPKTKAELYIDNFRTLIDRLNLTIAYGSDTTEGEYDKLNAHYKEILLSSQSSFSIKELTKIRGDTAKLMAVLNFRLQAFVCRRLLQLRRAEVVRLKTIMDDGELLRSVAPSPDGRLVTVPKAVHVATTNYVHHLGYLLQSHDLWQDCGIFVQTHTVLKDFYHKIDSNFGPLDLFGKVATAVHYFCRTLKRIDKRRSQSSGNARVSK